MNEFSRIRGVRAATSLASATDDVTKTLMVRPQPLITHRPGLPGVTPDCWIIEPTKHAQVTPVVCIHGINREAAAMARLLVDAAEAAGRTVIVPVFNEEHYRYYQRALCKNRSDKALLTLMRDLREKGVVSHQPFDLSGFSGGAQFAHRFAWFYPLHVADLTLCSAGWYTFPDDAPYPYGMGGGLIDNVDTGLCLNTNFESFIDRKIVLRVGKLDNIVDKNTRTHPAIDAQQGTHRVARAEGWVKAMRLAAEERGVDAKIDYAALPDCAHSFQDCVAMGGLDRLFVSQKTKDAPRAQPPAH